MSEKRRDNRNRILRNGESQRKDGRYAFKYIDATGKPQFVYSWKLEKTDKLPTGKRDDLSLREKEKLIQKDIDDQIVPRGGEMTVEELVRKYLMQKTGVRHNTEANYNFVLNIIKKEEFGKRRIDKVKQSDAKCWLIKLQQDGRGYSSIHSIRGVVRPAFQMAVDDDLIRKNPFEFQLATVVVNDSVTREAITRKQERAFLEFVASDKHFCKYYDGIYTSLTDMFYLAELFGRLIDNAGSCDRTDFSYNDILNKMMEKKPENRFESFAAIREAIGKHDFLHMQISDEDREIYQKFTCLIYKSLTSYMSEPRFNTDCAIFISRLEKALTTNLFETVIQKNADVISSVVDCGYRYNNGVNISNKTVRNFLDWFRASTPQSQALVLNNFIAKISDIEVIKPDTELPF